MSHPPLAISLPRADSLVKALNGLNEKEDYNSISFKRSILFVLFEYGVDCETTVRSSNGTFTGIRVLDYAIEASPWNVSVVLLDWMIRSSESGYDYVAAWQESLIFQGC